MNRRRFLGLLAGSMCYLMTHDDYDGVGVIPKLAKVLNEKIQNGWTI